MIVYFTIFTIKACSTIFYTPVAAFGAAFFLLSKRSYENKTFNLPKGNNLVWPLLNYTYGNNIVDFYYLKKITRIGYYDYKNSIQMH
jgi:hypothetical protein